MLLEHRERKLACMEISDINKKMNSSASDTKKVSIFDIK